MKSGDSGRALLVSVGIGLVAVAVVLSVVVVGGSNDAPGRAQSIERGIQFMEELCEEAKVPSSISLEVFMNVNATDSEIAAAHELLRAAPDVDGFRYLDKEAQYAEFERIFRKDPDLIKNVDAAALPASFRVKTPDKAAARRIERDASALPGVDDVASSLNDRYRRARKMFCNDR